MSDLVIIPAPTGFGSYEEVRLGAGVPASGTRAASGRVFRKHILNLGPLHYKGKTFNLDENWYSKLKDNFNSGVSMCQVPLADEQNRHSEDPLRNTGEVIGVERQGNKVYTLVDVRDPDVAQRIADKRIMGASAFLHMDYEDTRTQKKVGPALLHHCLTNRPYITDLEPYEEVVAATADMEWDDVEPVILAQPEGSMTKEELLAALRDEHGIDVEALQAGQGSAALSQQIVEALQASGAVQLTGGAEGLTAGDVVGAIVELSGKVSDLATSNEDLRTKDATREVEAFIDAGRLLPKSRDRAIAMVLSGDREGLEDFLSPVNAPYVKLSSQQGVTVPDGEGAQEKSVDAEIMRLTAEHAELMKRGQGRSGSVRK